VTRWYEQTLKIYKKLSTERLSSLKLKVRKWNFEIRLIIVNDCTFGQEIRNLIARNTFMCREPKQIDNPSIPARF